MNTGMQQELNYKVQIEPVLFTILERIRQDCHQFNISEEDFTRAVWAYADERVRDNPPQWLWMELAKQQQARDAANTIEGVAGDE